MELRDWSSDVCSSDLASWPFGVMFQTTGTAATQYSIVRPPDPLPATASS